ncbi:MAG: GGDEF domain-containing protein [Lachnospiraceae bacterium]|nr:GGDEF domain-containing protein [Lachnospiraceae bacterium]
MRIKRILIVLMLFVLLYLISVNTAIVFVHDDFTTEMNTDQEWNVFLDGEFLCETNNLRNVYTYHKDIDKGSVLVYETTLKNVGDYMFPAVFIKEHYCAYKVFLNDELIAEKYLEKDRRYIGLEQRVISLPKNYKDGRLTIELYAHSTARIVGLENVVIGDSIGLRNGFFRFHMVGSETSMLLIFFGAIYLFLTFLLTPKFSYMKQYIPLGLLSIELGLMIATRYELYFMLLDNSFSSFLYECTLFSILPLGIWSGYSMLGRDENLFTRRISIGIACAGVVLSLLRIGEWIVLPQVQMPFAILCTIMFIVLYYRVYRIFKQREMKKDNKVIVEALCICTFFMLIGFTFSGLRWLGWNRLTTMGDLLEVAVMCVGPMLFAYFLLLDFLFNISRVYAKSQEYDSLTRLAYEDGLTHIPNRARANRYLNLLERKKTDYCVISMDVNGLKKINDTYGHGKGDKLLKTFSKVLEKVYENHFYARIGGDEFLAVMEDASEAEVKENIRSLKTELDAINVLGEDPFSYSVAVGYAYRHETKDPSPHQTYLLADERMYDDKKQGREMNP